MIKIKVHNIDFIKGRISGLKSLDLKCANFEQIKVLLAPLVECGFDCLVFPRGHSIFRGRPMPIDKTYTNISEISYPKKGKAEDYKRASSWNHQVFYGAVYRMDKETQVGHVVATLEISKIYTKSFTDPWELIALGRWTATEDLRVAVVGLKSVFSENNPEALVIEGIQAELLEKLPPAFKEIRGEILKFLAEEFTRKVRNNYDYKISAAYCDLIFELGIDAIMFPSVQAEGLSFNIAIKKRNR